MIISRTPLRVSFFGGGSDIKDYYSEHSGAVLSTSIDKYLYVMVNKKFDPYIRIGYSETEIVHEVQDIKHNIIRECLKVVGGIQEGIDIVYMADVQPYNYGTGLGVSSSIAVGVLHALYAYKGIEVSQVELAEQACQVEIDRLLEPIGKQDQYAVALGGMNVLTFNQDDTVAIQPQMLEPNVRTLLEDRLYLVHTGLGSDSRRVLGEQKAQIKDKKHNLHELVGMVDQANALLNSCDIDGFGRLLSEAWAVKQQLGKLISNNQIDQIYERAINAGALGGKVVGSGGGGFLLLYCPTEKRANFLRAMGQYRAMKVKFESQGSRIVYADGARL